MLNLEGKYVFVAYGKAGFCFVVAPAGKKAFNWRKVFLPQLYRALAYKTGLSQRAAIENVDNVSNKSAPLHYAVDLASDNPRLWLEFDGNKLRVLLEGKVFYDRAKEHPAQPQGIGE